MDQGSEVACPVDSPDDQHPRQEEAMIAVTGTCLVTRDSLADAQHVHFMVSQFEASQHPYKRQAILMIFDVISTRLASVLALVSAQSHS